MKCLFTTGSQISNHIYTNYEPEYSCTDVYILYIFPVYKNNIMKLFIIVTLLHRTSERELAHGINHRVFQFSDVVVQCSAMWIMGHTSHPIHNFHIL